MSNTSQVEEKPHMCSTWIKDSPPGRLAFPVKLTVCSEHVLWVHRLISAVTGVTRRTWAQHSRL